MHFFKTIVRSLYSSSLPIRRHSVCSLVRKLLIKLWNTYNKLWNTCIKPWNTRYNYEMHDTINYEMHIIWNARYNYAPRKILIILPLFCENEASRSIELSNASTMFRYHISRGIYCLIFYLFQTVPFHMLICYVTLNFL